MKKFSLFLNWFNGVCAFLCGIWMMLSALCDLPLSWNDWMPLSIYDPFPLSLRKVDNTLRCSYVIQGSLRKAPYAVSTLRN